MLKEIRLEREDKLRYLLIPVMEGRADPVLNNIRVSSSAIIGQHLLIWQDPYPSFYDDSTRKVVGIAHKEEELPEKVYECARQVGMQLAKESGCSLVDLTEQAAERTA